METAKRRPLPKNVAIVADIMDETSNDRRAQRRDLEQTDPQTFDDLISAFQALGVGWHHYNSPEELARHADQHREDVVLSIFGGRSSRNRMMLVPAICESFGLRFIGPDTYGRTVAQDKGISKRLAVDAGLRTPEWRIARSSSDLAYALGLPLPVVVKPLMEGSSIGISHENLARTREQASEVAARLLEDLGQPIIIEEFIAGREVALTSIQSDETITAFSEVAIDGEPEYFENRLFDAHEKLVRHPQRGVFTIDEALADEDRTAIETFLSYFGDYGYCRVDGRLEGGRFHFIEFTPDAWLGKNGQFARSFMNKGWTYEAVIAAVISSNNPTLLGR